MASNNAIAPNEYPCNYLRNYKGLHVSVLEKFKMLIRLWRWQYHFGRDELYCSCFVLWVTSMVFNILLAWSWQYIHLCFSATPGSDALNLGMNGMAKMANCSEKHMHRPHHTTSMKSKTWHLRYIIISHFYDWKIIDNQEDAWRSPRKTQMWNLHEVVCYTD